MGGYVGVETTYTPIEYIESTGTQFINTGYTPLAHDKIVVDCLVKLNDTKAYEALFGSRDGSYAHNAYIFFTRFNASNIPTYNRTGAETQGSNMIYNERITLTTQDSVATWTNGTNTYTCTTTGTVEDCVYPLYVFDLNKGSQDGSLSQVKLYSLKIYDENDNLVRDFIPVLYSDGVAGLWENVEGRPYYNQGTGEFLYPEANTNDYDVLDYIESSGTQYLNIGFYANNNTRVEAEAMPTNISGGESWQALFSSKTGYHNKEYVVQVDKSAAKWYTAFGGTSSSFTAVTNNYNYYIDKNKNMTTINGVTNSLSSSTFTATQPMYIFTDNESGPTHYFRGRLFWLKVYDDGTLIRHLVPVKRKSDDEICMYDLVNNQFYTNAGTGVFAGGDVVGTRGAPTVLYLARKLREGYVGVISTYTPVEYIESSGTQYINTGYKPNGNTKYELVSGEVASAGVMFGAYNSTWTTGSGFYSNAGSNPDYVHYYSNTNTNYTQSGGYNLEIDKGKVTINNTVYVNATTASFNVTYPLYLFAGNMAGTIEQRTSFKLYSFKIYDDGILVRDFIPVVDDNNVACLWDKVEEKAYYNAGTGAFTAGNTTGESDIVVSKARAIKAGYVGKNGFARKVYTGWQQKNYIQSSGTQYIDTGFKPSSNTSVELEISGFPSTGNAWRGVFGARTASNSTDKLSIQLNNSNYYMFDFYNATSVSFSGGIDCTNETIIKTQKNQATIGTTSVTVSSYVTRSTDHSIYIFAINDNETAVDKCSYKLHYFKIWDGDTLVRDFIPVLDGNGVACLYDKLSSSFYYNKGTGTFSYG